MSECVIRGFPTKIKFSLKVMKLLIKMVEEGKYSMIRNIGFLFIGVEQLLAKGTVEEFSKSRDETRKERDKVIESINKALDVYDEIFPYTWFKPKLTKEDLSVVHRLMEKILYTTRYPIVDEFGAGLNLRKLF